MTIHANAKTGAHHHGSLESVIYVVKGRARMRWGEHLEFTAEAGPGDFIYVPPFVPHQEINASPTEALECVLCRSDGQAVAINLDIEPVEQPDPSTWGRLVTAWNHDCSCGGNCAPRLAEHRLLHFGALSDRTGYPDHQHQMVGV